MNREDIIKNNDKYGIKTIFYEDDQGILGYSLGNTIYLNTNSTGDLELVSKHELFHFFEETEKFVETKELLLNLLEQNGTFEALRDEYSLKYYGLYTDEEIKSGIIDTEIIIDLLAGNSKHSTEFIRQLGDGILNQVAREVLEKRYLVLNLRKNVATMAELSDWEKIFIENYYNQVNYDGITPTLNGGNRQEQVRKDIQIELNKLYELPPETFTISPNSKEVIREFESELKALEARGEGARAEQVRNNKEDSCQELARMFSTKLYEGYKHIVDFIKGTNYEDAFKVLVLRETLLKTYKKDQGNILVGKRKLNETIKGHMVLNETTLDYMDKNVADYDNFAKLYDKALQEFDKIILEKNNVSLDNVETYGKGHWIKFEGKGSDPENYLNNAQELTSLVQDTPWCTKTLAATQLEQGDFYVFVDNESKPHIAVKLTGNSIDEVRGILNDNAQELESDYRDVAISFLENNKSINGGKEWYEKEEWNKRLVKYAEEIDNGIFNEFEVENLLDDLENRKDYENHAGEDNSNLVKLKEKLVLIKDKIAWYYNCSEDEICYGDYNPKNETICPYKIILGNADFRESQGVDLGELNRVIGNYLEDGGIQNYGKLNYVGGEIDTGEFVYDDVEELIEYALWNKKLVRYIEEIDNDTFNEYEVENLLEVIEDRFYTYYYEYNCNLVSLKSKLELIKDKIALYFNCSEDEICVGDYNPKDETVCPYKIILGNAYFQNVTDLGGLQSIRGSAYFSSSKVSRLKNLKSIGKTANFRDSEITCLDDLESIGGGVDFSYSQVIFFGNLRYVGGKVTFNNPEQERLYNEHMARMHGNNPEGMHL